MAARNFTIYNSSNTSKIYFIINGETGKIGVGTGNPLNEFYVEGKGNFTGNVSAPWFKGKLNASYIQNSPWITSFSETDPYWTANFTLYNSSWSSTYNSTYNTWAYNQTTPARAYADATFITKANEGTLNRSEEHTSELQSH